MFERFTERARQVVVLAQDEARTLSHDHIGTEHLLLGLLRLEEGIAAQILAGLGVTVGAVRAQVARIVGPGAGDVTGQIPFTPRAVRVLELAKREALSSGEEHIGAVHILLGLVRENEGVGARILRDFDVDANAVLVEARLARSHPPARLRPQPAQAQLVIACPHCATPLETISTDKENTAFEVSAEGPRTCAGCGKAWTVAYTVSWRERTP
ncbi:MAG TPA: Clp protease N-terminal domain-containing protein [Gaiellales bacterium]